MEKERQLKVLAIVALVLAVTAMTLGYAAFSTTLNISSSASVTPTSEDFKIKIYGFKTQELLQAYINTKTFDDSYLSSTEGVAISTDSTKATASPAKIDNTTHTINNIQLNLTGDGAGANYYFIIKNEGKYDAYMSGDNFICDYASRCYIPLAYPLSCSPVANGGATPELVNNTCKDFTSTAIIVHEDNTSPTELNKIPVNSYIVMEYSAGYSTTGNKADGPFTVTFADFQINFSTAK